MRETVMTVPRRVMSVRNQTVAIGNKVYFKHWYHSTV